MPDHAARVAELEAQLVEKQKLLDAAQASNSRASPESTLNPRVESYRVPKLPPFFREDPALWFLQLESTFRTAKITDQTTMGDYVISTLETEGVACCRDIILKVDKSNLFKEIKERILATFSTSAEDKLRRLLKGNVLTDGKPSLVLHRLRGLDDGSCGEGILKSIFLDQLSPQTRAILAALEIADLNKLALIADQIHEVSGNQNIQTFAVKNKSFSDAPKERSTTTNDSINALTSAISELIRRMPLNNQDSRSRSRSKSREGFNRARSRSRSPDHICWAHKKFGNLARSCRKPCSWVNAPSGE